jgi:hypothetical protein
MIEYPQTLPNLPNLVDGEQSAQAERSSVFHSHEEQMRGSATSQRCQWTSYKPLQTPFGDRTGWLGHRSDLCPLKLRDEPGRLIVETAGVGHEVFVPLSTYYRMPSVGAEVEGQIRQIVREDAILLYGFATIAEKHAFDLIDGRAARRIQARARCPVCTFTTGSGCCDYA